jgi:hypothetical protein
MDHLRFHQTPFLGVHETGSRLFRHRPHPWWIPPFQRTNLERALRVEGSQSPHE